MTMMSTYLNRSGTALKAPDDEDIHISISFVPVSARPILRPALLAALLGVFLNAILRRGEWPKPLSGEVRLESGRVVDYTIPFDKNSLRGSVRVGDGLIALTSSGVLLRFELPAVRLVRERVDDEVACIGRGEGEALLAGLSDGRICRVDPATLELSNVVKPGRLWRK
jgi:hypothetical protein